MTGTSADVKSLEEVGGREPATNNEPGFTQLWRFGIELPRFVRAEPPSLVRARGGVLVERAAPRTLQENPAPHLVAPYLRDVTVEPVLIVFAELAPEVDHLGIMTHRQSRRG